MERIIRIFLKHYKFILVFSLAFIFAFLFFLPRFQLYSDDPVIYPGPNDPNRIFLEEVQEIFGGTDIVIVGVQTSNVFNSSTLQKIKRMTNSLEKIPTVDRVFSLGNAEEVISNDNSLETHKLIENIPKDKTGLEQLKKKIADNRLLKGRLVSDDGTLAIITISLIKGVTGEKTVTTSKEIKKIIALENEGPEKILLTGSAIITGETSEVSQKDAIRLLPIISLLVLLILLFNFRNLKNVLVGYITILLGIAATFGALALFKIPLTALTGTLPAILMVTGISYTLYLYSEFYSQTQANPFTEKPQIVDRVLRQVWLAVLLCALTTFVGFASLCISHLIAIKQMGIAAVLGTLIMLILNLFTLSAALFFLTPSAHNTRKLKQGDLLDKILRKIFYFSIQRKYLVLSLTVIFSILGSWGMTKTVSESDAAKYFKKGNPVRNDIDTLSEILHGVTYFDLILRGKESDTFKNPNLLNKLDKLQLELSQSAKVGQIISVNDFLKWVNRLLHNNLPAEETLPKTKEEIAQYLLLFQISDENRELSHYFSEDGGTIRIPIRTNISKTREALNFIKYTENYCRQIFPSEISCHVTGESALGSRTAQEVTNGMMRGFALGVFLISLILITVLRSVKMGIIAMIPNVLPIILCIGFMGLASIPFDVGTALMAPIVIGMTVDDTIRFFIRFFFDLKQTNHFFIRQFTGIKATDDQKVALKKAMEEIVRPMTLSSLIIVLGFGSLFFSSFVPIRNLGLLTAVSMLACVLSNLFILPAIISTIKI